MQIAEKDVGRPVVKPGYLWHEDLNTEIPSLKTRLDSFKDCGRQHIPDPEYLAMGGFVLIGPPNRVKCCACGLRLYFYPSGETFNKAHEAQSPDCPFLQKNNTTLEQLEQAKQELETPTGLDTMGLQMKCVSAEASSPTPDVGSVDNQTENQTCFVPDDSADSQEQVKCQVCACRRRNVVFLPCSHVVTCEECGSRLQKCPSCKDRVAGSNMVDLETTIWTAVDKN